jgi:hypothetical protein
MTASNDPTVTELEAKIQILDANKRVGKEESGSAQGDATKATRVF